LEEELEESLSDGEKKPVSNPTVTQQRSVGINEEEIRAKQKEWEAKLKESDAKLKESDVMWENRMKQLQTDHGTELTALQQRLEQQFTEQIKEIQAKAERERNQNLTAMEDLRRSLQQQQTNEEERETEHTEPSDQKTKKKQHAKPLLENQEEQEENETANNASYGCVVFGCLWW